MSKDHTLKCKLIEFLSKIEFKGYRFKDIRNLFTHKHPEFIHARHYSKIYQIIRGLVSNGLIIMEGETYAYKYSSNYHYDDLIIVLSQMDNHKRIKNQLIIDQKSTDVKIIKLNSEIRAYSKYMNLYPSIKEKIVGYLKVKELELLALESELAVLKKIIISI